MSTHPCLPLWIDDYDAATAHLSPAEDGVYGRLLRLAWRTPGCSLPNDPAWIARKIRLSVEDFETIAKPVLEEFFKVQRGRLTQKRLKAEYENISRKKTARQNAGKKGGDAKAQNNNDKEPSNATDLLGDTRAFPKPEPDPVVEEPDTKVSGENRPPDDLDLGAWVSATALLTGQAGLSQVEAKRFFGKLLSQNRLEARDLFPAVTQAMVNRTGDPKAYLVKAAAGIAKRRAGDAPKRVSFV